MSDATHIPHVLFTTELSKDQQEVLNKISSFTYEIVPFIKIDLLRSSKWSENVPYETDAWVFTSKRAVEAVLPKRGLFSDPDLVFAVGEKTADELKKYDLIPITPEEYNVKALSKLIASFGPPELIHFCGNLKVESLSALLESTEIDVVDVPVYETVLTSHALSDISFDAIVFMSPSAITSYFQKNTLSKDTSIFCIGSSTTQAIQKWGFEHCNQAPKATFDSLVDSLQSFYT